MADQARVEEIEFWRLNKALAEIFEERRDQKDLGGDLQDAQPLGNCRHRHSQRRGDVRLVQDLAGPARQQRQKPTKDGQIANGA